MSNVMDLLYSKLLKSSIFPINFVGILEMLCLFKKKYYKKKMKRLIDRNPTGITTV